MRTGVGAGRVIAPLVAAWPASAGQATAATHPFSPKHKKWLEEEVVYIISDEEKKFFRQLPTEAERDGFIEGFWLGPGPPAARPTELWFYSTTRPSLPNFFYLLFFQPDDASDYRLYSPVIDGPTKLAKGSGTENNPRGAFQQLTQVSAEMARSSLTFLTAAPIDLQSFTATMASDSMVTRIYNLPNDRFTKEMRHRRQALREIAPRVGSCERSWSKAR